MTKKINKQLKDSFPTIFFHSVSKEQLEKRMPPKTADRKKQVWLWLSVGAVMLVLIFGWAFSLPKRMKLSSPNDITGQLFKENKDKLSELFNQNKETVNLFSATPELYNQILKAMASSTPAASSTMGLTPEQIKNLKDKVKDVH